MMNNIPNVDLSQLPNSVYVPPQYLPPPVNGGDVGITNGVPAQNNAQSSYWDIPLEQRMQALSTPETYQAGSSPLEARNGNLLFNAQQEAKEWGTGLTNIWSSLRDGTLLPAITDYFQNTPLKQIPVDFANAILEPYNTQVSDFGTKPAKEIALQAAIGAYENPLSFTLDALSLGAGKPLAAAAKGINNKLPLINLLPSSAATKVEEGLAASGAVVRQDINKLAKQAESFKKLKEEDLAKLIEAAETGIEVEPKLQKQFEALKSFSQEYDNLVTKYSPATKVDSKDLSIIQKYARDNNVTYQQARRDLTPLIESDKAGVFPANNSPIVQWYKDASKLYSDGKIFPITHGLAEVDKLGAVANSAEAIKAGRFTTREWGNAAYADIAKQLLTPDEFLEGLTKGYVDNYIGQQLLEGKLGFISEIPKNIKDTVYLSRETLSNDGIRKALNNLSDAPKMADDIPLDRVTARELQKQLSVGGSLTGFTKDLYNVGKSTLLAQGTYLGANALTGVANTLMNSNVHLIDDIIGAIRTKGELSKSLGVHRYDTKNFSSNPVVKKIQQINRATGGGALSRIDKALQNTFAEVAANAKMRENKISFSDRIDNVSQMDKAKLGQMIVDVRRTALLNSSNSLIPRFGQDVAFAINPFWKWLDTATQSSIYMVKKHPWMANVLLTDILANIGFDREMQNRLNLGVKSDKPYVTYKFDSRTGEIKEMTSEFVPLTTTLKLIAPDKGSSFSPSIPLFTAIANATQGLDKYGNPNKRAKELNGAATAVVGKKRYRVNPNGTVEEIEGGYGDEILSTAIRETFGFANLWNRTLAPTLSGLIGNATGNPDAHFNQPYAQSIFGDFNDLDTQNNIIFGGNMDRQRTLQDVTDALAGQYSQVYRPEFERVFPSTLRSIYRNINRYDARRMLPQGGM